MKTRLLCMPTLCADIFDATGEILPGGEALNLLQRLILVAAVDHHGGAHNAAQQIRNGNSRPGIAVVHR